MSTIAFIGLGIMGSPMAVNLVKAGNQVIGYNRSPERAKDLVAAGGKAVDSIANAVAEADIVAVMVPASPDVQAVLTGDDGVFTHAKPGTLIIDGTKPGFGVGGHPFLAQLGSDEASLVIEYLKTL